MDQAEERSDGRKLFDAFRAVQREGFGLPVSGDLRPSEFHMLHAVLYCRRGADPQRGVTVSELSRFSHSSKPGVSQLLRTLEEKGCVRRTPAQEDRRVVYVALTDEGRRVVQEAEEAFTMLLDDITRRLGAEDTAALLCLMERLQKALGEAKREHLRRWGPNLEGALRGRNSDEGKDTTQ
jgi:DNA-binding MarR family transcriptional regulator